MIEQRSDGKLVKDGHQVLTDEDLQRLIDLRREERAAEDESHAAWRRAERCREEIVELLHTKQRTKDIDIDADVVIVNAVLDGQLVVRPENEHPHVPRA